MIEEFAAPSPEKHAQEEGEVFAPRFDRDGLITAVVTDAGDGTVLMVAHMNSEALRLTLDTGLAHYWSRSRKSLWKKGETSGNMQKIVELRTDCDQDVLLLRVEVGGAEATCHTGRRSCFYRRVSTADGRVSLVVADNERKFDPAKVYSSD